MFYLKLSGLHITNRIHVKAYIVNCMHKGIYLINIKLCFKVKCAVESQDAGCPLRGAVTGNEPEWGCGAHSILFLALFAWCAQFVKITALDT